MRQPVCRPRWVFASLVVASLVATSPVSAQQEGASALAAEIAALPADLPRDRLLLAPVRGLTTAWHPAPRETAIPQGTRLRLLRAAHPRVEVRWQGATEIYRGARWSLAEVLLAEQGERRVGVEYTLPNGQVLAQETLLRVVGFDAGAIRVVDVEAATAAGLAPSERRGTGGRHLTVAGGTHLRFSATTEPRGFEPLVEWWVDDQPQLALGPLFALRARERGTLRLAAGPPGRAEKLDIEAHGASAVPPKPPVIKLPVEEGFTSTARVQVTLDPGDPSCSAGADLALTSAGLAPTVVRRDPPPYLQRQVIKTELTQIELGAFSEALGQVLVRERTDRLSAGRVDGVVAERGQFLSGHSSFEVFVRVDLPDLGLSFDTGDQPVVLDGGLITRLPPLGTAYKPATAEPIPLRDTETGEQIGWLCHAEHVPVDPVLPQDPPPGSQDEDCFESVGQTTLQLDATVFAPALRAMGQETVPVDIALSSEGLAAARVLLDKPPYEPNQVIRTEMVRLELGGSTPDGGDVILRQRADRRSWGGIRVEAVDADGNLLAGEASFDLFLELEMTASGTVLHTGSTPIHVTAGTIQGLPPVGAPYEHDPEDAQEVPLYDSGTFQQVGTVVSGNHWPTGEEPCDECAVDLDIDSDNNNGVALPDRSPLEDAIEESPPGKYIHLNHDDDDGNLIRDLDEEPIRPNPPEDDPVFMVMEVSPNTPPDKWTLTYPPQVQVYDMDAVPPAIIPSGVTFPAPLVPNPKNVKVEGVQNSTALGDVLMTLTYECVTTDPYGYAITTLLQDRVKATVVSVDLDIDSDNTNGTPDHGPERNAAEEQIEDQAAQPGRYLLVNDDDDDNDQIADYGDGFNLDNIMSLDDVNAAENDFVRLVLEVPVPVDLNRATVRFTYDASDPATAVAAGNPPTITPAAGRLRLWKVQGPGRNKGKAAVGGDYVHTGDVHPAGNLGLTNANRTINLWLEGIRPTPAAPDRILVEVDPDGPGPAGFVAQDAVRARAVELRFISDANAAIVKTGANARLMLSNMISDRLTDAAAAGSFPRGAVNFNGPPTADPDNFRTELLGTPAGLNLQLQVEVVRPNNAARSAINYNTVAGAVGGVNAHRTSQQIRLVSNGADDGVGAGAQDATRLARIDETLTNDRARARVTLGATTFETLLPICRPPAEAQDTAIRTAALNFVTLAGVAHTTATTIDWMSQDWAQICIRFRSAAAVANQATVSNALLVQGNATGAGALTVTINTNAFNVPVANGDTTQQIATAVAAAINGVGGLTAAAFRHQADQVVIVNRGAVAQPNFNVAPASTAPGVAFTQPNLTFDNTGDNDITLLEGAVLGLNYKDNNNQTIDFFASRANTVLATSAAATGFDGLAANLPGWENAIYSAQRVLSPTAGTNTHLPGHEVGHSLFDVGNPGHSLVATNLFLAILTPEPNVNATKRLTDAQNTDARNDSGPGSAGPVLLQQN